MMRKGRMSRAWWVAGLTLLAACGTAEEEPEVPASAPLTTTENVASLALDGDDDFVDLGQVAAGHPLQLAGRPFTLAAWFFQQEGGDPYQRIIDKSDGLYGNNGWALGADANSGMIHFYAHDGTRGADFASGRGSFRTGEWNFVVAVARRDRLEIWLNGELDQGSWYEDGAHTLPADVATGLRLGTWNHTDGREWKGWLDEVAVWQTDLNPQAIRAIYEARGRADLSVDGGAYTAAGDLLGWWRMGTGAELLAEPTALPWSIGDDSGQGREGALRPAEGPRPDVGMVPWQ